MIADLNALACKERSSYRLIVGNSKDVPRLVDEALAEGWELYGSPFSDSDNDTTRICQAMIWGKKEAKP